jgi:hypothetical protein
VIGKFIVVSTARVRSGLFKVDDVIWFQCCPGYYRAECSGWGLLDRGARVGNRTHARTFLVWNAGLGCRADASR